MVGARLRGWDHRVAHIGSGASLMTDYQFASIMSALMAICVLIGIVGMALAARMKNWPWWIVFGLVAILHGARLLVWEFRR